MFFGMRLHKQSLKSITLFPSYTIIHTHLCKKFFKISKDKILHTVALFCTLVHFLFFRLLLVKFYMSKITYYHLNIPF